MRSLRSGRWLAAIAALLLAACQSTYFAKAGPAPEPPPQHALADWPDRDYWSGIVFNGQRIGFSHLALRPADTPGQFELQAHAAFALRFLGFDKRIQLKARDVVRADLDLVSFEHEYLIDGNALRLHGERRGDVIAFEIANAGRTTRQQLAVQGPVVPTSATVLVPTLRGLASGRQHRYAAFNGELQQVVEVVQRVGAFERSTLFEGEAFRVETEMAGQRVETWISPRGAPLLEIALHGVLIAGLEDESRARRKLAEASLNKSEALVDFALIRPDRPIERAREVRMLRLEVSGGPGAPPSDDVQHCVLANGRTLCTLRADGATSGATRPPEARDLAPSFTVNSRDAAVVAMAKQAVAGATEHADQIQRLVAWIGNNVRLSPADVWTALDVLQRREAECQGHTYLYAAFARSLGIPTRVVNGLVYSDDHGGFLFHTWAESHVDGRWQAVDPTFGQVQADATHLKLIEGETLADLTPLVDWIGRTKLRVIAVGYGR